MENVAIQTIARMRSDFPTKFGIPRQSGLVEELESTIVFEPEFRNPDALLPPVDHLAIFSGCSPGMVTYRPPAPFGR